MRVEDKEISSQKAASMPNGAAHVNVGDSALNLFKESLLLQLGTHLLPYHINVYLQEVKIPSCQKNMR